MSEPLTKEEISHWQYCAADDSVEFLASLDSDAIGRFFATIEARDKEIDELKERLAKIDEAVNYTESFTDLRLRVRKVLAQPAEESEDEQAVVEGRDQGMENECYSREE